MILKPGFLGWTPFKEIQLCTSTMLMYGAVLLPHPSASIWSRVLWISSEAGFVFRLLKRSIHRDTCGGVCWGCMSIKRVNIIYQRLHLHFLHLQASNKLCHKKAEPLTPEIRVCIVLLPEATLRLIAEDIGVSIFDPKAKFTLKSSQEYGMAIFSAEDWYLGG